MMNINERETLIFKQLNAKETLMAKRRFLNKLIAENVQNVKTIKKVLEKPVEFHWYEGRKITFVDLKELQIEYKILSELNIYLN